MRILSALLCLSTPAAAWEFSAIPVCTVSDVQNGTEIVITYDPAIPEYAIRIARFAPWAEGRVFGLAFTGDQPLTITTDRQEIGPGGRQLTVRDSGFGNVLDGFEFNTTATALMDGAAVLDISLDGAAGPIAQFRTCGQALTG